MIKRMYKEVLWIKPNINKQGVNKKMKKKNCLKEFLANLKTS